MSNANPCWPDGPTVNWNPLNDQRIYDPLHWRKPRHVAVCRAGDLFSDAVTDERIDLVFAIMASLSIHRFQIITARSDRLKVYMERVRTGGQVAAQEYESRMRAHFEKYKMQFREGYSLPEPPTPELRFIYDSAARQEERPLSPDGTTLHYGFSGKEYHWRKWPLQNVNICGVEAKP